MRPLLTLQDVVDLQALALRTVSSADVLEPALDLALTYEITVHDASYAALVQQLEVALITADLALTGKLGGSSVDVKALHEL